MTFRSEVNHGIELVILEECTHELCIPNVAFGKGVAFA